MSKWPPWLRWVYGVALVGAILAFTITNFLTDAISTPVTKLPVIYWLIVTAVVILYIPLVLVSYTQPGIPKQLDTTGWLGIWGSAFFGAALLFVALARAMSTPLEGEVLFDGVAGAFILLMAGSTLRNQRRAERK